MMRLRRNATAALATAALMLGAAACGGGNGPEADPTPTTSPTQSTSPTDTPGGPPTGWEDKFTRDQLSTYNAALGRWRQFSTLSDKIYREGKDTPEARRVLREYSYMWQRDVVTLASDFEKGGLRIEVPEKPLWTYAASITPARVVIVQCTDYSHVKYTKDGDALNNKPKHLVTPLVVRMIKPAGVDWMFLGSSLRDKTSCAG